MSTSRCDESTPVVDAFIARWVASGAAERANYQLFLSELADVLGVPRPEPSVPDDRTNAYVFERAVTGRGRGGAARSPVRTQRGTRRGGAPRSDPLAAGRVPSPRGGDQARAGRARARRRGARGARPRLWPSGLADQARAVREALAAAGRPVTPAEVARIFRRARTPTVAELLATLAALGHAREVEPGRFAS